MAVGQEEKTNEKRQANRAYANMTIPFRQLLCWSSVDIIQQKYKKKRWDEFINKFDLAKHNKTNSKTLKANA